MQKTTTARYMASWHGGCRALADFNHMGLLDMVDHGLKMYGYLILACLQIRLAAMASHFIQCLAPTFRYSSRSQITGDVAIIDILLVLLKT